MSNEQMKANRYMRMYENKKLYQNILAEIEKGLAIQVTNYMHSKIYTKASQFKCGKTGVYVQRGKNWDCINGSAIRSIRI